MGYKTPVNYSKVKEGSVVGRLTVLEISGKSKNGSKIWKCICSCGREKNVISSSLNSGLTKSCGCLYDEIKGKQTITHGKSKTKEYNSWLGMRQRCYYSKHEEYENYGGRGIQVCKDWKESFSKFYEFMGDCPSGMSLDRIDVNEDYMPENCKWSSLSDQAYNTRLSKNNKSGRTGVSLHAETGKWQASISYKNDQIYLGIFNDFENAVRARENAELKYFGYIKEERKDAS